MRAPDLSRTVGWRRVVSAIALFLAGDGGAWAGEPAPPGAAVPAVLRDVPQGRRLTLRGVAESVHVIDRAGRSYRLAGVHIPTPRVASRFEPAAGRVRQALEARIAGRRFLSFHPRPAVDRYGTPVVHLWQVGRGAWLQQTMLRRGWAQVRPWSEDPAMLSALFAAEAQARRARKGLWRQARYRRLYADSIGRDMQGRFRILVGRVRHVGRADPGVFLNFDTDWDRDTTLLVPTGRVRAMGGHDDLAALQGQWVEARGVLDWWNGPFLRVRRPGTLRAIDPPRRIGGAGR